jgi:hypothetical protein
MGDDKEVVEVTKVEEVKEKLTDLTDVDLTVKGVSDAVTTVLKEEVKALPEKLGLKMISESSLTEDQKKLAAKIYDEVKAQTLSFISDSSLNNTIRITKTVGQIIKQLETATLDGKPVSGGDKKVVAIQLGRILIKEITPDDKGEAEILVLYDIVAEPTLDAMIEVSKNVNIVVKELATNCLPCILGLFKRSK